MTGADVDYVSVFRHNLADSGTTSEALLLPRWEDEDWRKLFVLTTSRPVKASEVVIQRGVDDRSLYFVGAGSLEVGITYVDGISISPLARIEAGSVIGEQSFFDAQPRSANAWAVSDGEMLCLTLEKFNEFAAAEPLMTRELLFALGRVLSLRLRNTTFRVRR